MTIEEKNLWIYGMLAVVIPVVYAVVVLGQLPTTPVDQIAYVPSLITAIAAAIVLAMAGSIVLAILTRNRDRKDERDALISRRGELVGYYVQSAGIIAVLALVFTGQPHFWIANGIYAAFVVSAIASTVTKLIAHRRGF